MKTEWQIGERIPDPYTGLDRWEVLDVKRGGMGVVYICYDLTFRERVAAKTFQAKYLESERHQDLFMKEAKAWIDLERHPNIVVARYVKQIENRPYIFMEPVEGGEYGADLSGWIGGDALNIPLILNFSIQFCEGMSYALKKFEMLNKTFVHRDIKPGNIMVTKDRTVKVTDFGLLQAVAFSDRDGSEEILVRVGTPPYMSPEQCEENAVELDTRSDIYAFGCVMFKMLTGQYVFSARTNEAFYYSHRFETPVSPCKFNSSIPDEVVRAVMRCLRKEPENRYQSFDELREHLGSIYYDLKGERIEQNLDVPLRSWEWVTQSYNMAYRGRYEEALECCSKAIALDPGCAPAYSNKGWIYNLMMQPEKALECCDRAVALNPYFVHSWNNRGDALAKLGRHEEAIKSFDRAIDLDSRLIDAWFNKGNSLVELKRNEDALHSFDRVIELNPNDGDAWFNKGILLSNLKRYRESIRCFERVLEIDPKAEDARKRMDSVSAALRHQKSGRKDAEEISEAASIIENIEKCEHSEFGNKSDE